LKFIISILVVLLFSSSRSSQTNPKSYFDDEYADAIKFYNRKYNRIHKIISEYGGNEPLVMSIGFPELIRYSMWQDMIETKANEILYVKKGKPASNFSIGRFQIKPTFVEKLEDYINADSLLLQKLGYIVSFDNQEYWEQRKERLERLKSYKWQLKYIIAFCQVVESRFNFDKNASLSARIKFYSSAYNHDFLCDSIEIVNWIDKKSFPYGMKYNNPYSYAKVAVYFYRNDYEQIAQNQFLDIF
jgi:hypothetical protein